MSTAAAHVVDRFIAAVEAKDFERIAALLADDISYENMPIDPVVGREAVLAVMHGFLDASSEIDWPVSRTLAGEGVVMNERLDRFRIGSGWLELPVAGVFEVDADGRITRWRDYFDMGAYMRQLGELTAAG
jgi:limonene-1,2-epoxide hydrolase